MCEEDGKCCKDRGPGYLFRLTRKDGSSVEVKLDYEQSSMDTLLDHFEYFLRGCSFSPDGYLEFVSEEEDEQIKFIEDREETTEN